MKNEIFHMQVCTYVQTCYAQKTAQKGEKMVSILEYDKEWEEKKLRKAEYEAGKSGFMRILIIHVLLSSPTEASSFYRKQKSHVSIANKQ